MNSSRQSSRVRLNLLVFATAGAHVGTSILAAGGGGGTGDGVLECDLYIAESTIPNAGLGIFTGVAKSEGDTIGNGDKSIPLVDFYWHNGNYYDDDDIDNNGIEDFFNPLRDYVWHGIGMGMDYETESRDDITAFWPGVDAMVNCHLGLVNVIKAVPIYDQGGLHRNLHPGAGGITPYGAGPTGVIRDIPAGGEIFKHYGNFWFTSRDYVFGNIPLTQDYEDILNLMSSLKEMSDAVASRTVLPSSTIYEELIREMKDIWDSRTLNALHNFSWDDIVQAIEAQDMGIIIQPNATRSLDWLHANGKCIDHIVHRPSTIDGAGHGAFAKRDIPKGTIITGTPLIHFPDRKVTDMFYSKKGVNGKMVRDLERGHHGHQVLLNYCFSHPQSTILLCPYGAGVNYINHNKTNANVKVQWARHGDIHHNSQWLETKPEDMEWVYSTMVAIDYLATRDIKAGEEFFLDYGDEWEQAWQEHVNGWQQFEDREAYISASHFNILYGDDPVRTKEEQKLQPYPDNLDINCHWSLVEDAADEWYYYGYHESENNTDPLEWRRDRKGFQCEILEHNHITNTYEVAIEYSQDGEYYEERVQDVPRKGISFVDVPYTTDLHLFHTFRQPLGIPDEMVPPVWRNKDL